MTQLEHPLELAPYINELYLEHPHDDLVYHNLGHTEQVVQAAREIAAHSNLSEEDTEIVVAAAWFHDTGHLTGGTENHEERSVHFMRTYMAEHGINDEDFLRNVENGILATKMPHEPQNLREQIMCDADTYHLGTSQFLKTNKSVRKELKLRGYKKEAKGWKKKTLRLMETHHFYTAYCQENLAVGKETNLENCRQKVFKNKKDRPRIHTGHDVTAAPTEKEQETEEKQRINLINRGIQTMLRLTSENHLKLSDLADGKANILISVNAIIISVILSVLVRKLEVEPHLTIPTMLFLLSSICTIVVSILATQPKVSVGNFTREDIARKETNLLFFGNFHKSTRSDYEWAMGEMMKDKDYLYNSLVRDIYYLGVILGRKYKLIRLAYMIFMYGLIISVVSFTLAVILRNPENSVHVIDGTAPPI